jgi:ribonuclease III
MNDLENLLKQLNLNFKDKTLLNTAFTHRSYLNEAGKNQISNERLEFFGDAILSFLISKYLFNTYTDQPEGILTNLRSTIVKTETLSQIALDLNLGKYLFLSHGEEKGGGRTNPSLLADTFEAFLAAIYLDQGLEVTENFLKAKLFPKISNVFNNELFSDFKSKLQEVVQLTSSEPPFYQVVKTEGPDHAKKFWVTVVIDKKTQEIGTGKSKQEAEQEAARLTLEKMGKIE